MDNYLISIIVPIYNNEQFLNRCIRSIVNQSYSNLEIILINDGSTDQTPNICDKFAGQDERIKVIHKENDGVAIARNTGLDIAAGDYITFVDSDDYIKEDFCETLLENAIKYNADIVQCGYYRASEKGKVLSENKLNFDIIEGSYNSSYYYAKGENCTNYVCNKLFSKNIINSIRFPNAIVSEDFAFNVKAYYNSDKTIVIPDPLYYYIDNLNSVTNSDFDKRKLDAIRIGEAMFDYHKKRYPDLCSFFALYIVNYSIQFYFEVYKSSINEKEKYLKLLNERFNKYFNFLRKNKFQYFTNNKRKLMFYLFNINPEVYFFVSKTKKVLLKRF